MSAISNNILIAEGIFIRGMKKKNIGYSVWSTGKCHLNGTDLFKNASDFPGEKWASFRQAKWLPTKCETNYQCGVPIQIDTVPLLLGTNF